MMKKKILYTTPILEYPPSGGPELRIANSVKALNRVAELHVALRLSKRQLGGLQAEKQLLKNSYKFVYCPSWKYNLRELSDAYVRKAKVNKSFYLPSLVLRIINKLSSISKCVANINMHKDVNFICDYVKKNKIDYVWFGYGNISYELMVLLKEMLPKVKMVCDTDSVWSRFILRELDVVKDPVQQKVIKEQGEKKIKEEKEWVEKMDITTAVSDVDADYYKTLSTNKDKIRVFSNVIDLDMYKDSWQNNVVKKPAIYLAGSFGDPSSSMNVAAKWVLDDVYPILKKRVPNLSFYIVGKNSDKLEINAEDSSIITTGKVSSVLPYLCNVDVALVPLKFESGTRFKILEAAACNIPIVSTTLGAEGIPVENNKDIMIADSAQEFADAIVQVLEDENLRKSLVVNCKSLVEKNNSVSSLEKEAIEIIEALNVL